MTFERICALQKLKRKRVKELLGDGRTRKRNKTSPEVESMDIGRDLEETEGLQSEKPVKKGRNKIAHKREKKRRRAEQERLHEVNARMLRDRPKKLPKLTMRVGSFILRRIFTSEINLFVSRRKVWLQ